MPTLYLDTISDGSLTEQGGIIVACTRVAKVTGVAGTDWAQDALDISGIPGPNDQHPSYTNLYVGSRSVSLTGTNTAIVTINYAEFESPAGGGSGDYPQEQITIGTSLQDIETAVDVNGAPLNITYQDSGGTDLPDANGYNATTTKTDAFLTARWNTVESNDDIVSHIETYANKVNSATWFGKAAKTWKIVNIEATLLKPGVGSTPGPAVDPNWLVSYEAVYNPDTWQQTLVILIEGEIPTDADPTAIAWGDGSDNGAATFDFYETANFSNLIST